MNLPKPELGDLGELIAALALGAMGKLNVPGQEAPVDQERARWFIDRLEQLLSQLRMASLQE